MGLAGAGALIAILLACLGSLPWTLARVDPTPDQAARGMIAGSPRYDAGRLAEARLPPWWWRPSDSEDRRRLNALVPPERRAAIARAHGVSPDQALAAVDGPLAREVARAWPRRWLFGLLGTDAVGRSLLVRCLAGGAISLVIGLAAAFVSVLIGTLYGSLAAYAGGLIDAVMMRIVDILYGLPYILLVVLIAVAVSAVMDHSMARRVESAGGARERFVAAAAAAAPAEQREAARRRAESEALSRFGTGELSTLQQNAINIGVLIGAIGGISWLTMARVVRGQVLSLKAQPFMEAARAIGVPWWGQFSRHLVPNLVGPIVVYATLTVPQAILQESFLSFLGIGVKPPLPSWGNLAAEGLGELNTYKSNWWLLLFPCMLLGATLLALNFVGEGLREALDPRRSRR
jgi:oligopeptide transport system permease protein